MSKDREAAVRKVVQILGTVVVATAGACWTARGMLADYDRRLTVVETRQELVTKAVTDALASFGQDVRELRAVIMSGRSQ